MAKDSLTRIVVEHRKFTCYFVQTLRKPLVIRIVEYIINTAIHIKILLYSCTKKNEFNQWTSFA